jgi:preprotein translocase subunit YajC
VTEFEVGDRVRTSTGWDGEVRFVEEYFATVRVRMSNGSWWYSTRSIDRLTLIPDTVTIEVSREDAELHR